MAREEVPAQGSSTLSFLLNTGLDEVDPGQNAKALENDRHSMNGP